MEWNVYHYNINKNKIEFYNIFEHYSFNKYVKKAARECFTKKDFIEQLKSELRYYFWCKCEWELIIEITEDSHIFLSPWCGCRDPENVKINVTDDSTLDWKTFADKHIIRQIINKAKIDIYDQVMINWDKFVEYVWENRNGL